MRRWRSAATRSQLSAALASGRWVVACLCAAWCPTCVSYQQAFQALAAQHPEARLVWIDIEDHADALEAISPDQETHIHLRDLDYVDDACLEALTNWQQQRTQRGAVVVIEWDEALDLYRRKNPLGAYQRADMVVTGSSH